VSQERITIRSFKKEDAPLVSALIQKTLFTINSKDYPLEELEEIARRYSSDNLIELSRSKTIFVATEKNENPVGTATIQGDYISCVFVAPSSVGKGVGAKLMETVENDAWHRGLRRVRLDSSVTAQAFYKRRGYESDAVSPGTIAMHKDLVGL
jgi:GNAT superfamily N-acetyltransferase